MHLLYILLTNKLEYISCWIISVFFNYGFDSWVLNPINGLSNAGA